MRKDLLVTCSMIYYYQILVHFVVLYLCSPVGTNKGSMKRPSLSESSGRPSPALPGPSQEVGSKVKHEEHESSDEELGR